MNAVDTLVGKIVDAIVNPILTLFFVLSVLLFLFGMIRFLFNRVSAKEQEDGKQHMIWGVVGMAIMVSAWAIVNLLQATLTP